MKVNIGKNTLGDTNKMSLSLREYGRSTSNLSYAWRSTMGVGTLVPFMKIIGLPGDTFEIEMDSKILTNPTIGALFGSFKFQADIFTCPMRLYNAMLHNNALNIGLDMKKVKLPKMKISRERNESKPNEENMSKSNILAYLGKRKIYAGTDHVINGIPLLAYYDIFKNYYANKQEKKFPMYAGISVGAEGTIESANLYQEGQQYIERMIGRGIEDRAQFDKTTFQFLDTAGKKYNIQGKYLEGAFQVTEETKRWEFRSTYGKGEATQFNIGRLAENNKDKIEIADGGNIDSIIKYSSPNASIIAQAESVRKIEMYDLEQIDDLREYILSKGKQEVIFDKNTNIKFLAATLNEQTYKEELGGLCIKTHLSDLYNNWVNQEWVEGENGISKVTAIDTSSGSFTIDTINLAKKVYEMLNRIAISGGSYKDWIETVYTTDYYFRTETPVYEGGMSSEIEFEAIVSNSASDIDGYEPLGTLAGRGINTNKKGGKIVIKINEPCYIMGIASITPRVDYGDGEDWDNYLDTLDDLHKPQMDGIGFQDLLLREVYSNAYNEKTAIGKQPAWIQYTTNVNKTYADFAEGGSMSYMVLNKKGNLESAYITPEGYNDIFATTGPQERNFQVQIGCGITARRVKSAREIPTF